MLNNCTVMGRLTRDPEMRSANGTPVVSFTVACDRDYVSGGEKKVDFIDIVAWRSTAEFVSKYFRKGSMAIVVGRLQVREWTDQNNNKRRNAEIVADRVYFGEAKRSEGDSPVRYGASFEPVDDDGELPF